VLHERASSSYDYSTSFNSAAPPAQAAAAMWHEDEKKSWLIEGVLCEATERAGALIFGAWGMAGAHPVGSLLERSFTRVDGGAIF